MALCYLRFIKAGMRKFLYGIVFMMMAASVYAGNVQNAADSITDSWSVTYNGKEILAYTLNGVSTYLFDSIADNGVITIDYYTEEPCAKCQKRLQLRDENGNVLTTIQKDGFGAGDPFRLPGKQFRELMHDKKVYLFFSANPDGWGTWVFLGLVKTTK